MTTFNIITLFPELYKSFLESSLIAKAVKNNLLIINLIDLKEFGIGKWQKVDDTPYGGGVGMVLRVDVLKNALDSIKEKGIVIAMTPKGLELNQKICKEFSSSNNIFTILCGRYEGFDYRIFDYVDYKISIGNFVTMGGEVPSMCLIEAISRLKKGVIGNLESTVNESYSENMDKEYPNYTKPSDFKGKKVPDVLLSGNHEAIKKYRGL